MRIKRFLQATIFLALTMTLFGCGLELEEGGTEAQEIVQTKALYEEYEEITGTYEGEVFDVQNQKTRKVVITLFTMKEQIGSDTYGKPKLYPALKANLRYVFPNIKESKFLTSLTLSARYVEETNSISLGNAKTSSQAANSGFVPILSFEGTLINGVLIGDIKNNNGYFGRYEGVMTYKDKSYEGSAN